MFVGSFEFVVAIVFDNWFIAAAHRNPFVEADDVVQRVNGHLIEFQ
jgi:hypothetical protein